MPQLVLAFFHVRYTCAFVAFLRYCKRMSSDRSLAVAVKIIVWTGRSMPFDHHRAWRQDFRKPGAVSRYPWWPRRGVLEVRGPVYVERLVARRKGTSSQGHVHVEFSGQLRNATAAFLRVWKHIMRSATLRMPDTVFWRCSDRRCSERVLENLEERAGTGMATMSVPGSLLHFQQVWKLPTCSFVLCMHAFDLDASVQKTVNRWLRGAFVEKISELISECLSVSHVDTRAFDRSAPVLFICFRLVATWQWIYGSSA